MRTVSNAARGCGHLQEGGFYARSSFSPEGRLNVWAWALGEGFTGGRNFYMTVPPRNMLITNLRASLQHTRLTIPPIDPALESDVHPNLTRIPRMALVDHIGSNNYTPYSFYREIVTMGPSRRIPENIARQLARHTPLPILFTHADIPVFEVGMEEDVLKWANDQFSERYYGVSHEEEGWGLYARDYDGFRHWIIPALWRAHDLADGDSAEIREVLKEQFDTRVTFAEQALGVSWITEIVYVMKPGDSPQTLDEIMQNGIEPVIADHPAPSIVNVEAPAL